MNSGDPKLAPLRHSLELLGIQIRNGQLIDGQGPGGGHVYVQVPWALLVFDRWLESWQREQIQLVVPVSANVHDLWEWINDAAGIWPIEPLWFRDDRVLVQREELPREALPISLPALTAGGVPGYPRAMREGEREDRICWNYRSDHSDLRVPHVLIRSRSGYRLWSCDKCKFWSAERRSG